MYKSFNLGEKPKGSQLWHVDGGPGTCINLMFCLSEVNKSNGSMKCLSWKESKNILKENYDEYYKLDIKLKNKLISKIENRAIKNEILNKKIKNINPKHISQPTSKPGLLYAFRNNCIHAGGYPERGYERYVCVFHIYPNTNKPDLLKYLKNGVQKKEPFPLNPYNLEKINFNQLFFNRPNHTV